MELEAGGRRGHGGAPLVPALSMLRYVCCFLGGVDRRPLANEADKGPLIFDADQPLHRHPSRCVPVLAAVLPALRRAPFAIAQEKRCIHEIVHGISFGDAPRGIGAPLPRAAASCGGSGAQCPTPGPSPTRTVYERKGKDGPGMRPLYLHCKYRLPT